MLYRFKSNLSAFWLDFQGLFHKAQSNRGSNPHQNYIHLITDVKYGYLFYVWRGHMLLQAAPVSVNVAFLIFGSWYIDIKLPWHHITCYLLCGLLFLVSFNFFNSIGNLRYLKFIDLNQCIYLLLQVCFAFFGTYLPLLIWPVSHKNISTGKCHRCN